MDKKNKILTIIAFSVLALMLIGGTYAFFAPQAGGTTSTNATVTSNTTDLLTFSINRDISFTVTQNDFQENGTNQSGDATATATLTPNNKTGAATMNYYLYLNIEENPITYSEANTNGLPELMLQVFDGNNQLVTLTGLGEQVTVKGVTGYDITALEGLIPLLYHHKIIANDGNNKIENWRIVITLINHDFNQNDNTGKEVNAEILIQQESYPYTGTVYSTNIEHTSIGRSIYTTEQAYCAIRKSNGESTCDYDLFWITQEECQNWLIDNVSTPSAYNCTLSDYSVPGLGDFEIEASAIQRDNQYYLKHIVADDIIQSSQTCLFYNNHEFCMGPDYWDTDYQTTENKLIYEMESILGEEIYACSSYNYEQWCGYEDNYRCKSKSGGSKCGREEEPAYSYCYVGSDGESYCYYYISAYRNNTNITANNTNYLNGGSIGGDTYDGIGDYVSFEDAYSLNSHVFLTHYVKNYIIQKTLVGFYYNNDYFITVFPNNWGNTTSSIMSYLSSYFRYYPISLDGCVENSDNVECIINDITLNLNINGSISASDGNLLCYSRYNNGSKEISGCEHINNNIDDPSE